MRSKTRILLIALVSLILVLTVLKRFTRESTAFSRKSTGFYVELPVHVTHSACGDGRQIVVEISNDNSLRVNRETMSKESFAERLKDLYRVRVERVLFVKPDADVGFQEVVGIIDVAKGAVTNLYVSLLTPAAQKEPCLVIKPPTSAPTRSGPAR